jgi:hypothetical protein
MTSSAEGEGDGRKERKRTSDRRGCPGSSGGHNYRRGSVTNRHATRYSRRFDADKGAKAYVRFFSHAHVHDVWAVVLFVHS